VVTVTEDGYTVVDEDEIAAIAADVVEHRP
jgi:hypothetical protein